MRRFPGLLVASLLVLVVSTGTAAAHAKLESMTPVDGSTQPTPPTHVVLTFNEPVGSTGSEVQVTSPKGTNVSTGQITVIDNTVTRPVEGLVDIGTYTVRARIVSADGHPITVTGSFTTTHAGAPASEQQAVSPRPGGASAALVVALLLLLLAVLSLVVAVIRRGATAESP
ncbi:MAG TPA: copper resistance CopC family protein [Kribbella sp.]|nr:copper resistance CopC family protein [Kribbella sp.]